MDRHVVSNAKQVAIRAVKQAGDLVKERFDRYESLQRKGSFGDVVTEVDVLAEKLILSHISEAFPHHEIRSEEAGQHGEPSDWLWLVDPLDGTNNFAVGLPVFTVSISVMYQREPVLGVVFEPMTGRLFVSGLHEGSHCNGSAMQVRSSPNFRKGTIGWIQGHQVQHERRAVALRQHLDLQCKRVMRLWAPTLQWCLLAKGDINGIVLYNSEGEDLYSGLLMVKEAGGSVTGFDGNPFHGMAKEPYIVACHPQHKDELIRMVQEGLGNV